MLTHYQTIAGAAKGPGNKPPTLPALSLGWRTKRPRRCRAELRVQPPHVTETHPLTLDGRARASMHTRHSGMERTTADKERGPTSARLLEAEQRAVDASSLLIRGLPLSDPGRLSDARVALLTSLLQSTSCELLTNVDEHAFSAEQVRDDCEKECLDEIVALGDVLGRDRTFVGTAPPRPVTWSLVALQIQKAGCFSRNHGGCAASLREKMFIASLCNQLRLVRRLSACDCGGPGGVRAGGGGVQGAAGHGRGASEGEVSPRRPELRRPQQCVHRAVHLAHLAPHGGGRRAAHAPHRAHVPRGPPRGGARPLGHLPRGRRGGRCGRCGRGGRGGRGGRARVSRQEAMGPGCARVRARAARCGRRRHRARQVCVGAGGAPPRGAAPAAAGGPRGGVHKDCRDGNPEDSPGQGAERFAFHCTEVDAALMPIGTRLVAKSTKCLPTSS